MTEQVPEDLTEAEEADRLEIDRSEDEGARDHASQVDRWDDEGGHDRAGSLIRMRPVLGMAPSGEQCASRD
jgi:hypothetical protein